MTAARRTLPLLVLLTLLALVPFTPARAQARITSATVENGYPRTITFKVSAAADQNITDVTLRYALVGRGTSALGKPKEEIVPGRNVAAQVVVEVNSGSSYIPVASEFVYQWEITTADGATILGPEERYLFLPPGKEWKTVKNDFMTVFYHGDREALATSFLTAGAQTYEKIGRQLLKTTLRQIPVKVVLFADQDEMAPARPGGRGSIDPGVTTCGTKVTNDIVLVIPLSCGTPDQTDTLRHEFGHILNQTAGEGPLGKLPAWIDEGTAVVAQTVPGNNFLSAFDSAARRRALFPFDQMGTPTSDADRVNLFYGQSYKMVDYLIQKKGPATYAEFFATIRGGKRFDDALQQIYGFDLKTFETEFLAAVGSGPAQAPTAAPTRNSQSQPTAAPTRTTRRTTAEDDSLIDINASPVLVITVSVAAVLVLLAAFLLLFSQLLARRRTSAPPPPPAPPEDPPAP